MSYKLENTDHATTNGDVVTDTTDTSLGLPSPGADAETIDTMYENIMIESQV